MSNSECWPAEIILVFIRTTAWAPGLRAKTKAECHTAEKWCIWFGGGGEESLPGSSAGAGSWGFSLPAVVFRHWGSEGARTLGHAGRRCPAAGSWTWPISCQSSWGKSYQDAALQLPASLRHLTRWCCTPPASHFLVCHYVFYLPSPSSLWYHPKLTGIVFPSLLTAIRVALPNDC